MNPYILQMIARYLASRGAIPSGRPLPGRPAPAPSASPASAPRRVTAKQSVNVPGQAPSGASAQNSPSSSNTGTGPSLYDMVASIIGGAMAPGGMTAGGQSAWYDNQGENPRPYQTDPFPDMRYIAPGDWGAAAGPSEGPGPERGTYDPGGLTDNRGADRSNTGPSFEQKKRSAPKKPAPKPPQVVIVVPPPQPYVPFNREILERG